MENNNIFGFRLKKLLKNKNIRVADFAPKIGITNQAVYAFINGEKFPRKDILVSIAKELNVSSDYLLGLSDEPTVIDFNEEDQDEIKLIRRAYEMMDKNERTIILDLIRNIKKRHDEGGNTEG